MNMNTNSIETFKKAHRLANYISTAMLYLKDNYFLERDLRKDDIKDRMLGHWGTVPGINFIYQGLSHLATREGNEIMLVAGPGHGAPAILANTWIEKTMSEYYERYSYDRKGLENLIHDFSWPRAIPSHTTPIVPGTILEGGELGYSLATAFGAAFDNPNLKVACIIGDGEAETATLSASWQGNKFINPNTDGSVLPILHLNGYRISGPTIFSTMSQGELLCYFKGLGYDPIFVDQYTSTDIYIDYIEALITAFKKIENIKSYWQNYQTANPDWPIIILKTKKGWSGPKMLGNERIEDNNLSHGIPLQNPKTNEKEFELLKNWLESYKVKELLDYDRKVNIEIQRFFPEGEKRISKNKHTFGGEITQDLELPKLEDHEVKILENKERLKSRMVDLSKYLREILRNNSGLNDNFRIFSPDESESNLLDEVFDVTNRQYIWPLRKDEDYFADEGKVIELLSENVLLSMMQGYNLTGRHGVLISYEAFLNVCSSQIDQHLKYLKQSKEVAFRKPIPSLNLIATSTLWRQEHNGYTHQNPTLINSLIAKNSDLVKIYLPADINSLLFAMEECFKSKDKVNLIIACKRDLPQWMDQNEAKKNISEGYLEWKSSANIDVVLASSGDYQTNETFEAIKIINKNIPEINIKYVNISELKLFRDLLQNREKLGKVFTKDKRVVFNFHGYPNVIEQLTWGTDLAHRIKVLGYIEEGSTTTPFDMQVVNKASRYHVAIEALKYVLFEREEFKEKIEKLISILEFKLDEHAKFIVENGKDMDLEVIM